MLQGEHILILKVVVLKRVELYFASNWNSVVDIRQKQKWKVLLSRVLMLAEGRIGGIHYEFASLKILAKYAKQTL